MPNNAIPESPATNVVQLDEYESRWAVSVGFYRHWESVRKKRKQSDSSNDPNALPNHKRGAAAELALTKYLGAVWNATVNTFNGFPDLDGQMDARGKPEGESYIRLYPNKDSRKQHFIFVSVSRLGKQRFRVEGWMLGRDAMQDKYYKHTGTRSKQPEWQPPISDLNPSETLKFEVQRRIKAFTKARSQFDAEMRAAIDLKA